MTHKMRVLQLLSDGEPHSHLEGYRLGVMLPSRVADLRRDGHDIRCWRDGDLYLYALNEPEEPMAERKPSGRAQQTTHTPSGSLSSAQLFGTVEAPPWA